MSAAPRFPSDPQGIGYAGLRMTADEYLAIGETPERYELIDGVIVLSPSPFPSHNEIAVEITFQLKDFARQLKSLRIFPETDLRLTSGRVYRPDISVYLASRIPAKLTRLDTPPDLIVEVLSHTTKAFDLITKRDDYEAFGVAEYWAVDPTDATVRCWRRDGKHLLQAAADGDSLPCRSIAGFSLDLIALRAIADRG